MTAQSVTTAAEKQGVTAVSKAWAVGKILLFFPLLYVAYRLITTFVHGRVASGWLVNNMGLAPEYHGVYFLCFFLFFFPGLYLFNCALAGQRIRLDWQSMVLYMGVLLLAGITCEVGVDTLWVALFGHPLWQYQVMPLHGGYTSRVALVMWPMYGFYIYCLHCAIKQNEKFRMLDNYLAKAALVGIDAMALEILANSFALVLFHTYYFYYLPQDLHHFSSVQVFVPYVITANIGLRILSVLERRKTWRVPMGIALFMTGAAAVLFVI